MWTWLKGIDRGRDTIIGHEEWFYDDMGELKYLRFDDMGELKDLWSDSFRAGVHVSLLLYFVLLSKL